MVKEHIGQEFRFKNIDEARDNFPEETEQNDLMSRAQRKICTILNYIEHFTLALTVTVCFAFYFCLVCFISSFV